MQPPSAPTASDAEEMENRRKRGLSSPPQGEPTTLPRILNRHHARRRNVAASVWGPEIPSTPMTAGIPSAAQSFNVYKAMLRHPNIFFQFALRLPLNTIIDLYAIDKEFHYRVNKFSVSLIHDYARYHANKASRIFSWVMYPQLCISDPMLRPMDAREWLARDVPSFRWIKMVLWKQSLVDDILTRLALAGLRVPRGAAVAMMKFWVLMELNTTSMRTAFIQDMAIWSDADIVHMHHVMLKIDMYLADPIISDGTATLSHVLFSQKSLSLLWYVLSGQKKLDYDSAIELIVRTYAPSNLDTDGHPWLDDSQATGVPLAEYGVLSRERHDWRGVYMESAVDMLITEGLRRELHIQQYLLDFVMYGFVDREGRNVAWPRRWRGTKGVVSTQDGWPAEKDRKIHVDTLDCSFEVGMYRKKKEKGRKTR